MKRGDSRRLGTACSLKRTNIPRFNVELGLRHTEMGKLVETRR